MLSFVGQANTLKLALLHMGNRCWRRMIGGMSSNFLKLVCIHNSNALNNLQGFRLTGEVERNGENYNNYVWKKWI